MITIFNGRKRTLGLQAQPDVWAQVSVHFRQHIKYFKGAKLAVFLAISLHADEEGWAYPSRELLCAETGLGPDTVSAALTALCNTSIDGHRVLLKGQPRMAKGGMFANNSYLIFPTPEEIQRFAQVKTIKLARKAGGAPCRENAYTVAPCMPFPNTDQPYTVNPPQRITSSNQNQSTLSSAALIYVEVFSKTPNSKQLVALEKVEDLERWKGILDEWKLNGWGVNVGSMLDRYKNGRKKPKSAPRKRKGKVTLTPQVPDSTEEERDAARERARKRVQARRAQGFVPLEKR